MNGNQYFSPKPDPRIKEGFSNAKSAFRITGFILLLVNLPAAVVSLLLSEVLFFLEKQL